MNKKLLHKNIMESVSKALGKTLNEGAGGYKDLTIKGLTATNIEVLSKETERNNEIVKFHAELVPGQVEWKVQDYYDSLDSTGIFYDGMQVDEIDDEQRHVDGGEIYGCVYLQDIEDYDIGYGNFEEEIISNYIEDHLNNFEFKTIYGKGWVPVDLSNPMVFEDIDQNIDYECIFIDKIIINAPEIASVINWFFKNKDNFEEIYGLSNDNDDLDESIKIKTKKKSVTEDLSKDDKENAESKMDKWHEGKRKQNVKACSTDKLIMNLGICKRKGYDAEAQQLQDELDSRGINESQLFEDEVLEYDFGPEFNEVIEHVKNGTIDTEKDSEILFDTLVPISGNANTLAGELIRAANRIGYRAYNDGDAAGYGYGKETVNPAVRFMYAKVEKGKNSLFEIVKQFYRFTQTRLSSNYIEVYIYRDYQGKMVKDKKINQRYLDLVDKLLRETIIYVVENRLWEVPNNEDMLEYKDPKKDREW